MLDKQNVFVVTVAGWNASLHGPCMHPCMGCVHRKFTLSSSSISDSLECVNKTSAMQLLSKTHPEIALKKRHLPRLMLP